MVPTIPHGTPLDAPSGHDTISVASFNLLAPLYIRPIDQRTNKVQPFAAFEWISEEDTDRLLGNECRLPRLLQSMQACRGDFICVQELQLERGACANAGGSIEDTSSPEFVIPQWITPLIGSSGDGSRPTYGIILPSQTELEKIAERNRRVLLADAAITNAIFYRSDKWSPMCNGGGKRGVNTKNTTTSVTHAFVPADDTSVGDTDVDPIVITSIHLDACSEEKRVQQLQRCLEQSVSFACYPPPSIIAGDYNAELLDGSCLHSFLAEGDYDVNNIPQSTSTPLSGLEEATQSSNRAKECAASLRLQNGVLPSKEQLQSWDNLHDNVRTFVQDHLAALKRIDTGCTRVAYDHDEDPATVSDKSARAMAEWKLDHVLYTPTTLAPLQRWSTLEDDEHSRKVGLPNDKIPTDHLPIAATFQKHRHPKLSEEANDKLAKTLSEINRRQKLALDAKRLADETKRVELENEHREKIKDESAEAETQDGSAVAEPQPKKKPKQKKRPPPPEVIQHIRSSRAALKELKAEQRSERQAFVGERTILERMVLQRIMGTTCTQWVEKS
ncbi:hypothetical protein ACHAXT_000961 [Thalassiosira profunda]